VTEASGTTPLDPDESEELIPTHITTNGELDAWENQNILQAAQWLAAGTRGSLLTDTFVRELHRRMFDQTWRWAGRYRRSAKNIGIDWTQIPAAVHELCLNAKVWFEQTVFPVRQAAARMHHRLVQIHAFPNGNGRHARLFTDAVLQQRTEAPFEWGRGDPHAHGSVRDAYLAALRAADGGNFEALFKFLDCE